MLSFFRSILQAPHHFYLTNAFEIQWVARSEKKWRLDILIPYSPGKCSSALGPPAAVSSSLSIIGGRAKKL
jgi:hypothetical protein